MRMSGPDHSSEQPRTASPVGPCVPGEALPTELPEAKDSLRSAVVPPPPVAEDDVFAMLAAWRDSGRNKASDVAQVLVRQAFEVSPNLTRVEFRFDHSSGWGGAFLEIDGGELTEAGDCGGFDKSLVDDLARVALELSDEANTEEPLVFLRGDIPPATSRAARNESQIAIPREGELVQLMKAELESGLAVLKVAAEVCRSNGLHETARALLNLEQSHFDVVTKAEGR